MRLVIISILLIQKMELARLERKESLQRKILANDKFGNRNRNYSQDRIKKPSVAKLDDKPTEDLPSNRERGVKDEKRIRKASSKDNKMRIHGIF